MRIDFLTVFYFGGDNLNKKGEIYVLVCVFLLVIIMIFSAILTYSTAISTVKMQKTNTEIVFDSFVAKNSIKIFNNIKQGNNFMHSIDTEEFYSALVEFCTLEESGGKYYSISENGTEKFSLTIPQMGYTNTDRLELYVSFTMNVPIKFAGTTITNANVPIKIVSELKSKK